jgi:hypothetical protein
MAGAASKAKVAYVPDAFGLADTVFVGDLFTRKAKKNLRKANDPRRSLLRKRQGRPLPKIRVLLVQLPLP